MRLFIVLFLLALCLPWAVPKSVFGQDPGEEKSDSVPVFVLDTLVVIGRIDDLTRIAITASEGRVGIADIKLRPMVREGEVLEAVPGMILTQHAGDGKSNQMFVRGFNLDHGTDFASRVEGMPINMPTHAHGQGYTDLNFLIPDAIDYVEYKLGVYYAGIGDFGSAGGADIWLPEVYPRPFLRLDAGSYSYLRLVGAGSTTVGPGVLSLAGEARGYDGPWDIPQNLQKLSGIARYTWHTTAHEFTVLGMGYRNSWDGSDQIPERAVAAGVIDRFGQVDSTLGGITHRFSLSGRWRHVGNTSVQALDLYGIYYDLDLYSNFTYFLDDPVTGDQLNQVDNRVIVGANFRHSQEGRLFGRPTLYTAGLQTRADFINDLGLYNAQRRQRVRTIRVDDVIEWGNGLYITAESRWTEKFRTLLGLRGDFYLFDVTSDNPLNSGDATDAILTPKLSLMFGPWGSTELYLSGGFGFHSNDARGTTQKIDPKTGEPVSAVNPLVLSRGAELGVRSTPVENWRTTLTAWALELDSELLFVGDAGTTEPTERSRRFGVTWTNFYRPTPMLSMDFDVALVHARFATEPEDYIPGAMETVLAAGVMWDAIGRGVFGAVRLRHFGAYPLIEDNSIRARPATLLNATLGYRFSGARLGLSVLNILGATASDIEYFYASRGRSEPPDGVDDIHFKTVEPRTVRFSVSWGL